MEDLRVDASHLIAAAELSIRVARSSGPGGQGVNTTDAAVELRWDLDSSSSVSDLERQAIREALGKRVSTDGILIVRATRSRSQWRNRQAARRRLAELVADALRPRAPRVATRPSRKARARRREQKRRRSETKRLRRPPEH